MESTPYRIILFCRHPLPAPLTDKLPIGHIRRNLNPIPLPNFNSAEQLAGNHLLSLKRSVLKLFRPAPELPVCRHNTVRKELLLIVLSFQLFERFLILNNSRFKLIKRNRKVFARINTVSSKRFRNRSCKIYCVNSKSMVQ